MIGLLDTGTTLADLLLDIVAWIVSAGFFLLPLWWPLFRALRLGLPRKRRFIALAATMSIGAVAAILGLLVYPLNTYFLFIAPSLQSAGLAYGRTWHPLSLTLVTWAIVWIPVLFAGSTWWVTRMLSRRWVAICMALQERSASRP